MSGVLCTWQGLQSGVVFFLSAVYPLGKMPVCRVFNYLSCQGHACCQNAGLQQISGDLYRWPKSPPQTFSLCTRLIISFRVNWRDKLLWRYVLGSFFFFYLLFCLPVNEIYHRNKAYMIVYLFPESAKDIKDLNVIILGSERENSSSSRWRNNKQFRYVG